MGARVEADPLLVGGKHRRAGFVAPRGSPARLRSPALGENPAAWETVARKAAVSTLVVLAVVALALALWKLKVVIALVFLGFILAAAMRPGVDRLAEWRIPRPAGVALHYLAIAGALALLLWLASRVRSTRSSQALGGVPTSQPELNQQAKHSAG